MTLALLAGCPEPGAAVIGGDNTGALANSVWAGETPRAGDWLTITFRPENKAIWSFSIDNTSNEWGYSYNSAANAGTIAVSEGWNPAPGGFSISGDTLAIANYGSHSGPPREFRRLRRADLTVDPVPFVQGPLDANLVNSVWAGETPRAGDWLTITFRPENKAIWSFSIDNTSNEWGYSYNSAAGAGTITVSEGWNPAPGGFSISGDTLTIANYGSHSGAPRAFRRYR